MARIQYETETDKRAVEKAMERLATLNIGAATTILRKFDRLDDCTEDSMSYLYHSELIGIFYGMVIILDASDDSESAGIMRDAYAALVWANTVC